MFQAGMEDQASTPLLAAANAEKIIAGQLAAFNDRDLCAFMSLWCPDARLLRWPDRLVASGKEDIRRYFRPLFAQPFHHALVLSRISLENLVVDQAAVTQTRRERPFMLRVVAIYEVGEHGIAQAWLKSAPAGNSDQQPQPF